MIGAARGECDDSEVVCEERGKTSGHVCASWSPADSLYYHERGGSFSGGDNSVGEFGDGRIRGVEDVITGGECI